MRAPPPDVSCLAQTNDGYLWLCSTEGLFRFDGTRFESFRSPYGDLWIGYLFGGFSILKMGRVTNFTADSGSVSEFAQGRDGTVWAATSSGLWRFDGSGWQHIGDEWNVPARHVQEVGFDSKGILWALMGNDDMLNDLIYLLPGALHFKTAGNNFSGTVGFIRKPDQTVLTSPSAQPLSGSGAVSSERLPAYKVTSQVPGVADQDGKIQLGSAMDYSYNYSYFVKAQLMDREGNIWYGNTRGIERFFYTPFVRQQIPNEGSMNLDFAVVADDHGTVWVSFTNSHDANPEVERRRLSEPTLYRVPSHKADRRFPKVTPLFAYRAPDKTFWFSGKGCLWHLVGKDFVRESLPPEMADLFEFQQSITGDRQGGLWVSFGRHGLYRLAKGNWTPYGGRGDLPRSGVIVEFTDSLGRVWFGYTKSQLAVLDGDRVRTFGPGDGLQVGNIKAIYGRGSEIWIGGELGLEQFDQGRFHKITAVDDEWLHGISGIVETVNGDLWLNGVSGIFHVRKAEITEALNNPEFQVKGEHFGRREGLPGAASQLKPLPTAIEGTDGRLWFALRNGVVWLDPAGHSEKRKVPPPVSIQSISADDKFYAPDLHVSFPAHTSSVQVNYAAVSLSDPEAIRFRYRLQETDKDWREVAAASPVTFRNLPPGSYHFSVEASDTNGVWSGAPAKVVFTILPAFYQTFWFRLLCVAVFLALLWQAYRLRVHQLRAEERKLREAIETIPAMAWISGPDGAVQFANRRWVEYTGLSQLGNLGEVGKLVIHPEDLDRSVRRIEASSSSGEPFEDEMRFRRTDGEYRWFLSRAVPLRDKRGKVMKWYGAATDIQDRKRAEELQAELAHTNRVSTMGELVTSIAHELAQPITVTTANARASLRWLQRDPPELTELRKGTERIMEAGTLASEIIDRLRSLYKKSTPRRELVAMNNVVDEMVPLLRGEATEYGVSLRTDLAANLPKVAADRVQVQQVLMNLMHNGIEAMKETGGVLTVKSQLNQEGQIQISIQDSGPDCQWARSTRYSTRSLRLNRKAAAWGWRSVVQSWIRMVAICGLPPTKGGALYSILPCLRLPGKQPLLRTRRDSASSRVGMRYRPVLLTPPLWNLPKFWTSVIFLRDCEINHNLAA
jgi:PAS domain S-box-containing protein